MAVPLDVQAQDIGYSVEKMDQSNPDAADSDRVRIDAIVRSANDAIWSATANGLITSWNPASERLFGHSAVEMVGRTVELLFQSDRPRERTSVTPFETIVVHKDGTRVAVEISVSPMIDDHGAVCGTSYIARNVSVRDALKNELRLLNKCLAHLNDIVLITEAEPFDEPGPRILFVNKAFEKRTGYSAAEAVGRSPKFLQGKGTDRRELDRIRVALEQWQPVRAELLNYKKDGTPIWLELDIAPVAGENGWFTHWIAVERDITDRKSLQQALLDATTREQLKLGRDLHDGLAQELAGLSLMATALATSAKRASSSMTHDLESIAQVAQRAIAGCRAMAHGLSPLEYRDGDLIASLREMLNLQLDSFGVDAHFDVIRRSALKLDLKAQESLYRIAHEAVANARLHSRARSIRVTLEIQPKNVLLEVLDDGVGMPNEVPQKTGIGRMIMRYRAEAIGARLSIEPGKPGGTLVSVKCAQPP